VTWWAVRCRTDQDDEEHARAFDREEHDADPDEQGQWVVIWRIAPSKDPERDQRHRSDHDRRYEQCQPLGRSTPPLIPGCANALGRRERSNPDERRLVAPRSVSQYNSSSEVALRIDHADAVAQARRATAAAARRVEPATTTLRQLDPASAVLATALTP
jgi:hypothetical protein